MRNISRIATVRKSLTPAWLIVLLVLTAFGWLSTVKLNASPPAQQQAVTDRITYNAGDPVRLRIIFPSPPAEQMKVRYLFTVRYGGEAKPVADGLVLGSAEAATPGYRLLWKTPLDARPGRYEIDMRGQDPGSHQITQDFPRICSFVVHRQVIQIGSAEVREPYYRSGDAVGCSVKIENLSGRPLAGLRLEFSEHYWPWIAQQTQKVGTGITTLQSELNLKPHERTSVSSFNCTEAKGGDQETIRQYAAVVWDHDRKNVLAIALTPLVFINPPGAVGPRPYPLQYVYPGLEKVDTSSYRHFHPEPLGAGAIRFETQHTMFVSGSEAKVRFSLTNPTDAAWRQVTVRARLLGPGGEELANHTLVERADLNPHSPMLKQQVSFTLPRDASGLYHIEVQIADAAGQTLATNRLELGVNPLPKSVLVFCAHEDDDGTQMGFIRSLVENQVPLHMVYFTSGDAGSCDRYFQHTCGPAEALNFAAVRMQEARAAMGHLGVSPENILFLGLPDGGTGKIWYDHPKSSDPYLAVLLASDHAPYDGLFRTNLSFARDAVIEATEEIIKKFQPEVIFTVHPPSEGHIDHIVNNYFVVKALQELLRAGAVSPATEVRVDRIFDPKSHPATPYRYEDHEFYVSGEAMALAQEAEWFYQSQGGNREQGNLRTWDQLLRSEGYRKVLDWKEHEGWNEKE
jgi:LmbE family N-acetylglucosaminyl deacetylase